MGKLLSVIMPTHNRAWILEYSLDLIQDQIKRNSDDVELIICNNASTDNTVEIINKIQKEDNYFTFVNYNNYVEIGVSLSRSIDNATGRYILLWGDDDVPAPNMIDIIVEKLKKNPNIGCIHFNRLQGNPGEGVGLINLQVFYKDYTAPETLYHSSKEFTKNHYRGMCFLSCYVFSKDAWLKGNNIWTSEHLGFEYLAPILYGLKDKECLYLNYPLCVQRFLNVPQYIDYWPLYVYVGIPRVLQCLEKKGCIDSWKDCYDNYHSAANNMDFVWHILMIACNHKEIYIPYYDEIQANISTTYRHNVLRLLKLPNWMIKLIQTFFNSLPRLIRRVLIPKYKINK